jgi:hypothetical protein
MRRNFAFLTRFIEQEKTEGTESHMKLSTPPFPPFPPVQIVCLVAVWQHTPPESFTFVKLFYHGFHGFHGWKTRRFLSVKSVVDFFWLRFAALGHGTFVAF